MTKPSATFENEIIHPGIVVEGLNLGGHKTHLLIQIECFIFVCRMLKEKSIFVGLQMGCLL